MQSWVFLILLHLGWKGIHSSLDVWSHWQGPTTWYHSHVSLECWARGSSGYNSNWQQWHWKFDLHESKEIINAILYLLVQRAHLFSMLQIKDFCVDLWDLCMVGGLGYILMLQIKNFCVDLWDLCGGLWLGFILYHIPYLFQYLIDEKMLLNFLSRVIFLFSKDSYLLYNFDIVKISIPLN